MAHLATRYKIIVPSVLTVAAVLIALPFAAWVRNVAHAGAAPRGGLTAQMAPVVRVVPGFEHGHIPWIASPCDSCRVPVTYALQAEPHWDSCDGMAGTFGWDPAVIQVGFRWTGSSHALVGLLNDRLGARGWARGAAPSWSGDDQSIAWISPHGHPPAEVFTLDPPLPANHIVPKNEWTATVLAKPQGQLAKGC